MEVRDPIHGFIELNDLERAVINSPAFQRLRRIRQLAFTEYVYPSATHTRFAHSIGVMHVATRAFDKLADRHPNELKQFGYEDAGVRRSRQIVRLAALLHDLGHAPFSHASEELFPINPRSGKRYTHEEYTESVLVNALSQVLEESAHNKVNLAITPKQVVDLFGGGVPEESPLVLWRSLISGHIDADRMDYLLRDSYFCGVRYGSYDVDRILNTLCLLSDPETDDIQIGIEEDGIHAAEGLLIARYMMFNQVYFHKTRVIYDFHLERALSEILSNNGGHFPLPNVESIGDFLDWDDRKVMWLLDKCGGEHGKRILDRDHYRLVLEARSDEEIGRIEEKRGELENRGYVIRDSSKSWYRPGDREMLIKRSNGDVQPMSSISLVAKNIKESKCVRVYVKREDRDAARAIILGG